MEDVKKSYLQTVTKLKDVEVEFQALTQKLDAMEAQTSALKVKVESSENEERSVYDSYFLGKVTEKDLETIRNKTKQAKDALSTHSKMLESLNRCITGKDKELSTLRKQVDSLRHQVWSSLFQQKAAAIPETVRAAVRELICVGLNSNRGLHFILPEVFPLPGNEKIQQIYQKLATELNIE